MDGGEPPGFDEYLRRSNPLAVAHHIAVPALILHADDDPICTSANVRHAKQQ